MRNENDILSRAFGHVVYFANGILGGENNENP